VTRTAERRVLVIGLDGATFRLLKPFAANGLMPRLGALLAEGCHGELRPPFPPLTPPSWSTYMTGKNPGKHGVIGFRMPPSGSYRMGDFVSTRALRVRTLWEIVSEAGLTVGTMHVVPSYPVRPVNGFMVGCMLAPPGAQDVIYPPELRPLLGEDYAISVEPPQQLVATEPGYRERALDYLRQLRRLGQRRLATALRLLRERPCDLLSVIFYEADRVQHFFWSHVAGDGPAGVDRAVVDELATEARAIYADLDVAVGELRAACGPETVTLVVSDHGFGPAPARHVHVNRWLADHGFLRVHRTWNLRRRLVKRLPRELRKRWDTVENVFVDWSRTQAWCDALETRSAAVWVNVRGRLPQGCVAPGAEYDRVCEDIRAGLAALRDGDRPAFQLVARRGELYHGPMTELAPDLMLYCSPSHGLRFNGIRPELRARRTFVDFQDYGFTGAHEPSGIYAVAGPGVRAGGEGPAWNMDAVAPTILALLGVPVPDGMDGTPILDFLTPETRATVRVEYAPDHDPQPVPEGEAPSAADQEQIEARLRALGYVE
jgi:predicted AlkP superfamily phosphohydrolase/phosphomutase